jgi:4-amino-4-deoxy-L-arabinose transferase-like glycosyltransferase
MTELVRGLLKDRRDFRVVLACVAAITLARMIVLVVTPLELHPDEAQYWWWAQTPAFGYFSKPPMVAWIIWGETFLLGNAEWVVRIASPLLHGTTALVVFALGRRVYDSRVGLLSALAYLTTPGVSYSSSLLSTDVPLLLCWAVALHAFVRGLDETAWRWPVLCGGALGLGLLSKYAMIYFFIGAAISALIVPRARALIIDSRGAAILATSLLLVAPNIWWNAQHGFPTLTHVGVNADWGHARYSLLSAAGFFFGQLGVFGPLLMAGYLMALWRLARNSVRMEGELVLAAFSVPPLALMLAQSFIATANANWAATAYVAATPLATRELARWWQGRAVFASSVLNGLAMIALWIVVAEPAAADRTGFGNAFKREEGWRSLGAQVVRQAAAGHYDAIASDNRSMIAELLYYARASSVPIRAWSGDPRPRDHFQMTIPLQPGTARVLLAVEPRGAGAVTATFDSVELLDRVVVAVGGRHQRVTQLYDARNYRGP